MIRVVYMSPNPYGGWVTFTSHLMNGLGNRGRLFKVSSRRERNKRNFGYGVKYRNITLEELKSCNQPILIAAVQKNYLEKASELLKRGAYIVIHDPNEFYLLNHIPDHSKIITIRKSVNQQIPGSFLIPHPYRRAFPKGTRSTLERNAVSVSRIDFDKHTEIILRANKKLRNKDKVELHGFENRLYGKFKLMKEFPEWKKVQSTHKFEKEDGFASRLCNSARYAVDLSVIKKDGGGTQYTFLEAMDGGAVNVLHKEWTNFEGEMKPGKNCLTIGSVEELIETLKDKAYRKDIVKEGEKLLRRHECARVVQILLEKIR